MQKFPLRMKDNDLLVTELAVSQGDESRELLRRMKHALDAHRGGGDRQPLGD